jgi:hypothetical protein
MTYLHGLVSDREYMLNVALGVNKQCKINNHLLKVDQPLTYNVIQMHLHVRSIFNNVPTYSESKYFQYFVEINHTYLIENMTNHLDNPSQN